MTISYGTKPFIHNLINLCAYFEVIYRNCTTNLKFFENDSLRLYCSRLNMLIKQCESEFKLFCLVFVYWFIIFSFVCWLLLSVHEVVFYAYVQLNTNNAAYWWNNSALKTFYWENKFSFVNDYQCIEYSIRSSVCNS